MISSSTACRSRQSIVLLVGASAILVICFYIFSESLSSISLDYAQRAHDYWESSFGYGCHSRHISRRGFASITLTISSLQIFTTTTRLFAIAIITVPATKSHIRLRRPLSRAGFPAYRSGGLSANAMDSLFRRLLQSSGP